MTTVDLTGQVFGTLRVLRLIAISPERHYEVRCESCGSRWNTSHQWLKETACHCQNSGCAIARERKANAVAPVITQPSYSHCSWEAGFEAAQYVQGLRDQLEEQRNN